jgi:hypothetical protein
MLLGGLTFLWFYVVDSVIGIAIFVIVVLIVLIILIYNTVREIIRRHTATTVGEFQCDTEEFDRLDKFTNINEGDTVDDGVEDLSIFVEEFSFLSEEDYHLRNESISLR